MYSIGIIAMKYWLAGFADASHDHKLTADQTSLIVSILSAGTFIGALSAVSRPLEALINNFIWRLHQRHSLLWKLADLTLL
jgi:hypothetical protein